MKKFMKKCIISIISIYLLLSIIINVYYYIETKKFNNQFNFNLNGENIEQQVIVPSNFSIEQLIQISNYSGKLELAMINIKLLFASIILGILIGLTLSIKEDLKYKYLFIYAILYIIINTVITVITVLIFQYNGVELSFIEQYTKTIKIYIIPYTIAYFIIFFVNFCNTKVKIKNINKELK